MLKNHKMRFLAALIMTLISVHSITQVTREQAVTPPPGAVIARPVPPKSPEILPDNSVTFRIYAPKASEVALAGEWMTGEITSMNMVKGDTGLWTITTGPIKPEYYGYKFIIDGATVLDPNNLQIRRDWQGYESVLLIPGKETELYFPKNVPGGTLSKVWYNSPTIGLQRRLYVYMPPGYEKSNVSYPVLYLLHGGMNDEDTWSSMGRVNVIMDNLIAQGLAVQMIVVMPNGNPDQAAVPFESYPFTLPSGTSGPSGTSDPFNMLSGTFEASLVKDVIPFIEANYRIKANSANRAIIGYSMGGGQTFRIVLDYPEVFGYIGTFGPAIFAQPPETEGKMDALNKANPNLFWVGVGVDDQLCYEGTTQILIPLLKKHNINYYFNETTGGHNWPNWRIFFSECVPELFK
jgi:enterochelin esterase-like enzyme